MKTLTATATIACLTVAAAFFQADAVDENVDCSPIQFTIPDCMNFVADGSTLLKPRQACCTGLESILKASAECLCIGFRNIATSGIAFNFTKALSIPAACNLPAPASNCGIAPPPPPKVAPSHSPKATPPAHAPQPASAPGSGSASAPKSASSPRSPEISGPSPSSYPGSPASPPKSGSASMSTISLATALVSLLVASFVRI